MRSIRLLPALLFLFATAGLSAQDVHYTLHDYSPLWLNPAQTGGFSGSVRVGGIYRGQWGGLNSINSPTAFVDAPVIKGFRKYDWIGAGASLVSDNAGVADLKQSFFGFSGSYHLALDKNRRNVITLGAQYGSTSYSFEVEQGQLLNQEETISEELGGQGNEEGEEFDVSMGGGLFGGGGSGGNGSGGNSSQNFNSINAGLMLRSTYDPKTNSMFEVGVALFHIGSPERRSLLDGARGMRDSTNVMGPINNNTEESRERRSTLHAHARLDMATSGKWRLQPTMFYQASASTSSLSLQAWGARPIKEDINLRIGVGYRTGDAVKALAGLDYKQLRAALSYDFIRLAGDNVPTVSQSAFEITANYIFNFYKKPEVKPTMLCPRI